MTDTSEKSVLVGLIVLIMGAVAIGMAAPLVKLSELGPQTVGFWRMALTIPFAFAWMQFDRNPPAKADAPSGPKKWLHLALPGLLFAGDLAFWHAGIKITSVANATFLANLQPVFVVLAAWLIFKETITRQFLMAAGLAVAGAALLSAGNLTVAPDRWPGDALSIATAVWYASYILAVRQARRFASTGTVIFFTALVTAPILALTALGFGEDIMPPTLTDWLVLIGLAVGVQIIGQGGVAFGLGRVPAPVASIIILIQPVVASIAGWIMFGEAFAPMQYAGAALVMTGVYWVQRRSRTAASRGLAKPPGKG
ncbi:DMT family transporter [Hyphobacterium sp. HN65]|uniref:DMT family transporter n=1 Tax=Hyphobacterium lacteum TaxID=3116575 RepID=A0ABU7LQ34_9PROT|nr:DMT family transporter [Hyphobacterium sp. HN65]MEE2526016.1 DMT family transporter [Hyphobacterium sp. HN65]